MGTQRNGARTFLDIMHKACSLSRFPGFVGGMRSILGVDTSNTFLALWVPLCSFIDVLVATDNFYNRKDATEEGTTEDGVPEG